MRGLKENVILGHLIPAGSAFPRYQCMRVKHHGEPIPVPTEIAELGIGALATPPPSIPMALTPAVLLGETQGALAGATQAEPGGSSPDATAVGDVSNES